MMLRRLTLEADIYPLKTLVDVIEPLNEYQRWGDFKENNGFTLKSYSPYTRIMDVANPDSDKEREFNNMVNGYLLSPTDASRRGISDQLLVWKVNQGKLQSLINASPVLKEIESLSADLSIISELGMESLGYISANTAPSAKWIEESKLQLSNARKPRG